MANELAEQKKISEELIDNFQIRINELVEIRDRLREVSRAICENNDPKNEEVDKSSEPDTSNLELKLRHQDRIMANDISDIMYHLSNIERFV